MVGGRLRQRGEPGEAAARNGWRHPLAELKKQFVQWRQVAVVDDADAEDEDGGSPAGADPASVAEAHYRAALLDEERGDKQAAVEHYKAALGIDPGHVAAIAGLGRLRFVQPDQPFFDELRRRRPPVDACEVIVQIRNPCNFRCFYCCSTGLNNVPVQRFDLAAIDRAYAHIHSKLIVTSFDCEGGEPTVHPQFRELLAICASRGAVSMPSNNSQNPERWLPRENARRILVRSALHPENEENLDRYIGHARYLIDAGCEFLGLYIAHPTRIEKIPEYRELLARHGIPFQPVAYSGVFEGRRYPYAYTEEQKRQLGLEEAPRLWAHKIEPHASRIRNFRGIPCIAGHRSIYITNGGSLHRCPFDTERALPAPLPRSEPCGVGNCGCGLWLDKLNTTEWLDLYNYWGGKIGLEGSRTEWMEPVAQSLGYEGVQEAMAAESIRMYDALMAAYGKDEFPE